MSKEKQILEILKSRAFRISTKDEFSITEDDFEALAKEIAALDKEEEEAFNIYTKTKENGKTNWYLNNKLISESKLKKKIGL